VGYPHQGRRFHPDDKPPATADDGHYQNHLLEEENRRLKEQLNRAEQALRTAAAVLRPYAK
jgi:hypothetical protein